MSEEENKSIKIILILLVVAIALVSIKSIDGKFTYNGNDDSKLKLETFDYYSCITGCNLVWAGINNDHDVIGIDGYYLTDCYQSCAEITISIMEKK